MYVIDTEGVVRFVHAAGDYRWRLEPDTLIAAVRDVPRTHRGPAEHRPGAGP